MQYKMILRCGNDHIKQRFLNSEKGKYISFLLKQNIITKNEYILQKTINLKHNSIENN